MFSSLWKSLGEGFGSRWLLTSFGPALVFWGASLLVYGGGTDWAFLTDWENFPAWFQTLLLAASLAIVVFTAYVLDLFTTPVLRLAEGYGWEGIPLLGARQKARADERIQEAQASQERFAELQKRRILAAGGQGQPLTKAELAELQKLEQQLYYRPPDPERMMPTDLGNVLRAAEDAVRARYGLNPIVCWPRLYPLLPEAIRGDLAEARSNVDTALRSSLLGVAFSLLWGIWALARANWLLAVSTLVGLIIAWLGYRAAVQAAVPYADLIRAAFDLYRFDLYETLRWPLPKCSPEERPADSMTQPTIGQRVSQYLWRGDGADDIRFQHEKDKVEK